MGTNDAAYMHLRVRWVAEQPIVRPLLQQVLKDLQVGRMRMMRHARASVQRRASLAQILLIHWDVPLLDQEPDALQLHVMQHFMKECTNYEVEVHACTA